MIKETTISVREPVIWVRDRYRGFSDYLVPKIRSPTKKDITENPLNLDIKEVEAANTASLLPDVAAAVINGGHAVDNGLNPEKDSIFLESVEEGSDNPYVNIIVARTADKDNELYKKVVDYFRTPEVAKVIEETYKGAYIPTWE